MKSLETFCSWLMVCLHVDPSIQTKEELSSDFFGDFTAEHLYPRLWADSQRITCFGRVDLQLQTETIQQIARSGTGTRGSELAVVVPAATRFSEKGPLPSEALDWKKVNTSDNTVSLLLPVGESLRLFIYRYTEDYSLIELEQELFNQSLHLNSIDFWSK